MKPMTVKELIAKLQECDPEMEVYFNYNELVEACETVEAVLEIQRRATLFDF